METLKQKALRFMYPMIRKMGQSSKNGVVVKNIKNAAPKTSFYSLRAVLNNNQEIDFKSFAGKKVLLVNTASNCGYTGQYAELQTLHEKLGDQLMIIGFPANDFASQEKGNDSEIAQFCQVNYGVNFPIAKKGAVVKNAEQQAVYQWLTDSKENGWNNHQPDWNFGKYLVNEEGKLIGYFGPSISPLDGDFLKVIKK